MCSIPMAIVGGAKAISSFTQSSAEKNALQAQEKALRHNATLADIQARDSIEKGRSEVENYQRQTSAFKSSQNNIMAENGIDVTEGSAIDILASTDMVSQADVNNLKYNAAMESWGHQVQKNNLNNQANGVGAQASAISPVRNMLLSVAGSTLSSGEVFKTRTPKNGVKFESYPMYGKGTLLGGE